MSRKLGGFKPWLLQRISALYLGLFTLYAFYHFLFAAPQNYYEWMGWVTSTPVMLALLLAIGMTLLHAWIGVRDILIDYIPITSIRLVVMTLVGLLLSACGVWALVIFASRLL